MRTFAWFPRSDRISLHCENVLNLVILSFRMCGYIVAVGMETFVCHVFSCSPHAGTLTRAIEEACKVG